MKESVLMTDEEWSRIAWRYMRDNAPVHDCGRRFDLGGLDAIGPMFVCAQCSFIAAPDPEVLAALQERAADHADRLAEAAQ